MNKYYFVVSDNGINDASIYTIYADNIKSAEEKFLKYAFPIMMDETFDFKELNSILETMNMGAVCIGTESNIKIVNE